MIPDSNILNNKRKNSSFSVQILSIFTFSRRNRASFSHYPTILGCKNHIFPECDSCSSKKDKDFSSFEKQKEYALALHQKGKTDTKKHITNINEREMSIVICDIQCFNNLMVFS